MDGRMSMKSPIILMFMRDVDWGLPGLVQGVELKGCEAAHGRGEGKGGHLLT